jgi:LAO/AO transport system kinase
VVEQRIMEGILRGEVAAIARALTMVEERLPGARALQAGLAAHTGRALRVGLTGAPGAGKSTLLSAMIAALRRAGKKVAVLAVDPSSPKSGGALLGDRVRMAMHACDVEVFVRSMAGRAASGALAPAAGEAVDVLDAAGFDVVFLESVGAGQADIDIALECDVTLVLVAPGGGDGIQALKSGILEIADLWVVTKGDRPEAAGLKAELISALSLGANAKDIDSRVLVVAALGGQGVEALLSKVQVCGTAARASGALAQRQLQRLRRRVLSAAAELLAERLPPDAPQLAELAARVRSGDLSVIGAARALLAGGNA